jgi:hypothetical protein
MAKTKSITVSATRFPPMIEEVTPIQNIAGKQIPAWNLKEHPELDGARIVVTKVKPNDGASSEFGPFVVCEVWVIPTGKNLKDCNPESDLKMIITGADNVYERTVLALSNEALPFSATLRKSGRSWFLD